MESTEIWKDILGYEGLYQISSHSRVKSLSKKRINSKGEIYFTKEKILEGKTKVCLTKDGKEKPFYIHKIYDSHFFSCVDLDGEIWVDVSGFEGYYKISNLGRIKSSEKAVLKSNNRIMNFQEKILNLTKHSKNGYYSVGMRKDGINSRINIHRLVALHFLKRDDDRKEVNHKDLDKSNNRFDNLEWVFHHENQSHLFKSKKSTSKFIGVCSDGKGKWLSFMCLNGKRNNLGTFATEEEAYQARKKFERDNNIVNKYS